MEITGMKNANPTMSFILLRRLIGILGMLLPLVCYVGGKIFGNYNLQPSISFYYYTNAGVILVGILVGVAMFLMTYRGYEIVDDVVSTSTGFAGLGIVLFPCLNLAISKVGFFQLNPELSNTFHSIFAMLFFLLLAINSIFIFTLTDNKEKMSKKKKIRNFVYISCGIIIFIGLTALGILHLIYTQLELDKMVVVFIIETVLLEAFGISWLVKGQTILKD